MALSEETLLEKYLRPLCDVKIARNLQDDSAALPLGSYIISTDNLVENVHFLPSTSAHHIAKRLLARNLSDMAGSAAKPRFYLLNWVATEKQNETWINEFCKTLAESQAKHNIKLIGGDGTKGTHLSLTMTILGEALRTPPPTRLDAKVGDQIFVSGTLGEAFLGLQSLQGVIPKSTKHEMRYLEPPIRCLWIEKIITHLGKDLHALMDISDGLPLDCQRLAQASKVSAEIEMQKLPLVKNGSLAGGDDYELLFTVAPERCQELMKFCQTENIKISEIGKITAAEKSPAVQFFNKGTPIHVGEKGWQVKY